MQFDQSLDLRQILSFEYPKVGEKEGSKEFVLCWFKYLLYTNAPLNLFTTKEQTTKFTSANFQKI